MEGTTKRNKRIKEKGPEVTRNDSFAQEENDNSDQEENDSLAQKRSGLCTHLAYIHVCNNSCKICLPQNTVGK